MSEPIRNRIIGHLTDLQDTDHDVLWSCAVLAGSLAPDATALGRAAEGQQNAQEGGALLVTSSAVRPSTAAAWPEPADTQKHGAGRAPLPVPEPAGGQRRCTLCGVPLHCWDPRWSVEGDRVQGQHGPWKHACVDGRVGECAADPQPAEAAPGGGHEWCGNQGCPGDPTDPDEELRLLKLLERRCRTAHSPDIDCAEDLLQHMRNAIDPVLDQLDALRAAREGRS